jgi:hypothetical protein
LASSVAGAGGQQKSADVNRTQQDGAARKFQIDRADQLEKTLGDIGESNETDDDRDADGRMPWSFQRTGAGAEALSDPPIPSRHAPDLTQERGGQLDLDA